MQTLQQQRAKHALQKVKDLIPLNEGDKLKARANELPFMIHTNGLGQALAFFKSKKDKDGYDKLFLILQSWLTQNEKDTKGRPFAGKPDLMVAITEADFQTYRIAQAEAIQYMDWVKKFASAYL
jgi:CRISPR-associated protein Cmr5